VFFALGGLLLLRHALVLPLVKAFAEHRVLVLGTGPEARLVEASLASERLMGISLAGFYADAKDGPILVPRRRVVAAGRPLVEIAPQLGIHEIILAVRDEHADALPVGALLACQLQGVRVTDLAGFFEQVHGRIPIELVNISWLANGKGYRWGW